MPTFRHEGIDFNYQESGAGLSFFFQHGLGADVNQPFGLFRPPNGYRLLAFDCRGHGLTQPLGDLARITVEAFADDLRALMDHLGIGQAVVGGISMGSALAVAFALRHPERALGLVLSRPAWVEGPQPPHVAIFAYAGQFIQRYGARRGQELFRQSPEYAAVLRESPDAAASLLRQFEKPGIEERLAIFERIAHSRPEADLPDLQQIRVPTLVLSSKRDPIHPIEYGRLLARTIPGAIFRELTPKSVSVDQHAADVQREIERFLLDQFPVPKR